MNLNWIPERVATDIFWLLVIYEDGEYMLDYYIVDMYENILIPSRFTIKYLALKYYNHYFLQNLMPVVLWQLVDYPIPSSTKSNIKFNFDLL